MVSIVDTPLQKQSGIEDKPLDIAGSVPASAEDSFLKATRMAQAATLKSELEDRSPIEAMAILQQENKNRDGKSTRMQEASKLHDVTLQDARQLFFDQAFDLSAPEESVQALKEVEAAEDEARAKEDFPIRQYVEAISAPNMTPEQKESLATNLYLQDKLNEIAGDIGLGEMARDLLLEIVISPKAVWDNAQVTGSLNPFTAEKTYRNMVAWFQGMSNEDKVKYYPAIQEYVLDAMDRTSAVQLLQGMIDPAYEEGAAFDIGPLGAVDLALIGAGTAASALKLRKILNPIKAAAKAGDKERAAETNVILMQELDEGLGAAMGVDRHTATTNALPFLGEGLDDAAETTLSPAVHERIFQFRDRLKEAFGNLADAKSFVREGFLDDQDRTKAVNRLTEEYNTYVANTFAGKGKVVNLEHTEVTSDGVTFKFSVTDAEGNVVENTYTGRFSTDDIGFWQNAPHSSGVFSEKQQAAKSDFMSTVNAAIRLDNTAASISSQLRKVVKDAAKPIRGLKGKPRKQRVEEVDRVLITGDDMQKEFTPEELKAGVNGIKLDEQQIEYYYNMRGVMNGLGILRNMDARRAMEARGVKSFVFGKDNYFGTPVQEVEVAAQRLKGLKNVFKFDPEGARSVEVASLRMSDEYAQGYRLVRLEEDTVLGGSRYQHVLVKSDSFSELPAVVLDLKKGYIPRINPKATYFVQAFTPSSLDGVASTVRKAIRSFDNQAEAQAFAARFDLEKTTVQGLSDKSIIRVVEDGELEAFRAGDSGMTQTGGLIYSPRARVKIPHNDGGVDQVPRTSALEAIELYLENTKNYMSRNEWRMGLRQKWENTAKFKLGSNVKFEEGETIADTDLRNLWHKISDYSGYMDKSERAWEQTVKGVYEWAIEKSGRGTIPDFILSQRQKDPLARMRSVTFHTLLGWFNPIQLWVQAQGAAVAMSMNITRPDKLQRFFRQQNALAMLTHLNFDDSPKMLSGIAKAAGYKSVDEMQQAVALWKKSGLYDSTLSSADVEAAARGFPTTGTALNRFAQSGLMFFRAGELFNRRFAFLTAIDELGGAAKVSASEDLLKKALTRTNDLILNLGKANRASWQKGVLSIPTQFLQIQAKTIESILGLNGALNKSERAKLLMGQMALYGAAGVFGGQWAVRQMANLMGKDQIDVDNMNPAAVRALTGGFTDWFLYMMGANVIGSDRGALLNGMDQTFLSLFTEESTAFEWLGGPSSVAPTRIWQKLREISPYIAMPQDINGQVDFAPQDVSDVLQWALKGAGQVAVSPFSSARQIDRYFLMRDLGQLVDKNGNVVAAPTQGFNWQTEWASLIGFKPELLQRKYDLSEINEETRKYVEFRSNLLIHGWDSFLMAYNRARDEGRTLTEEELREHRLRHNVLINSIKEPQVRRMVRESFARRLRDRKKGNSQLDRQMQKYYENMLIDVAGEFTSSDTRLIQTTENE